MAGQLVSGGMARRFTKADVERLIEEATAPLHARIAQLEAELARAKKGFFGLVEAAFRRPRQAAEAGE